MPRVNRKSFGFAARINFLGLEENRFNGVVLRDEGENVLVDGGGWDDAEVGASGRAQGLATGGGAIYVLPYS